MVADWRSFSYSQTSGQVEVGGKKVMNEWVQLKGEKGDDALPIPPFDFWLIYRFKGTLISWMQ